MSGPPVAPSLTARDAAVRLARLRRLAYWLDDGIPIPGTRRRIGLDPVIGLIPGLGDAAGGLLSLAILVEGGRLGASRYALVRMAANIALDATVGAVPVLGDLFDAAWKANVRNVTLLERHLIRPEAQRRGDRTFVLLLGGAALAFITAAAVGGAMLTWRVLGALTSAFR